MPRATIRDEASRARVIGVVAGLNLDKPWEVSIAVKKSKRSLEQNRLYHKWAEIIANETGNSHGEICDYFKSEFLPRRFVTVMGKTREVQGSTTELKVAEMTTLLTQVEAFAGSLGIVLPHPDDQGRVTA